MVDDVGDRSARTIGDLFLEVERVHDRNAVVRQLVDGRWEGTPDWRFHRRALRVALYFDERLRLEPGRGVALAAKLGPDLAVIAWAALSRGSPVVLLPVHPGDDLLVDPPPELPGAVVVVGDDGVAPALPEPHGPVVGLGPSVREGTTSLATLLDLGGTLDTGERANAFRSRARAIDPGATALVHPAEGRAGWERLRQGDILTRVRHTWSARPPRTGDDVELTMGPVSPRDFIALIASIAGGHSCAVFSPARGEHRSTGSVGNR
ncbi:MAG TPA: hypothetical protein VGL81_34135 [Polyangiaceae bacterium]|jgi:hypothetical protein